MHNTCYVVYVCTYVYTQHNIYVFCYVYTYIHNTTFQPFIWPLLCMYIYTQCNIYVLCYVCMYIYTQCNIYVLCYVYTYIRSITYLSTHIGPATKVLLERGYLPTSAKTIMSFANYPSVNSVSWHFVKKSCK